MLARSVSGARDVRLDVWRGLCLVDVVLVHLAYNGLGFPGGLDDVIKHYTRFAAGGFVYLAGLTVAVVFGPAVARGGVERRRAYARLWRRAGLLLLVDVAAATALRLLDELRVFPMDADTPLQAALAEIFALQRPGVTGGIFLLYALLLAAMPLAFEIRRVAGNGALAALSVAAYALALASGGALAWPPYDFPALYWQPLFFAGFLSLPAYQWLQRGGRRRADAWVLLATAAFALVFLLQFGPLWEVRWLAERLPLDFAKTPLQLGAVLWYLAAVQAVLAWSHRLWTQMGGTVATRGLALLGRHSLLVYTAHVFTEVPVLEIAWGAWPSAGVRTALGVADLAALATLAWIAELGVAARAGERLRSWLEPTLRWAAAPVPIAAALLLAVVLVTRSSDPALQLDPLPLEGEELILTDAEVDSGEVTEPVLWFTCEEGEHCTVDGYAGPWEDVHEAPALVDEAEVAEEI